MMLEKRFVWGGCRWRVMLLFVLASTAAGSPTKFEVYPEASAGRLEGRVAVSIGTTPLPLICRRVWHTDSRGEHFIEVAGGRFAADGPVKLTLRGEAKAFGTTVLQTCCGDLPVERNAHGLELGLPGPGQYYLRLPALARSNGTFSVVFWVDDLKRLEAMRALWAGPAVKDVTRAGIRADPEADQTAAIQRLLEQGGVFYFPPGLYRAGSLRLRSNTTLYFAPGSILRALDDESAVGAEFIASDGAQNVRLCGPGTLDANSLTRRRGHNVHHVNITGSRNVILEDLLLEESNSWAVHVRKTERFTARNLRIFSGKDGFDPDASRDVLIEGAFVASADDAIAVKNRFPNDVDGKTTERVVFTNSIVTTIKSALKVGTETQGPIRDVRFENCDVFDGERGLVLYARDGGPIERVTWRGIRLHMRNWPQEKESGSVFHFTIEKRLAPTPVRDCLVENVSANWLFRSEFGGVPEAPLTGVTLRNIRARVESPKRGRAALLVCRPHADPKVEGFAVDWNGHEAEWAGTLARETE